MRRAAVVLVLLALTACSAGPPPRTVEPAPASPASASPSPAPTPSAPQPDVATSWPVPRDSLTPGLVVKGCTYPRDASERAVKVSTKRAAAARYGYTGPAGIAYVEYDHRIPFSLCGADTIANIWPEPADGVRQTRYVHNRKDQLAAFAARQVRYKRWTLPYAQQVFRGDWREAWCTYLHYDGVVCP